MNPYKAEAKMSVLDEIQEGMIAEIDAMNEIIRSALTTEHPLVNSILDNYLKTKGKQIRPILVLLAAGMFGKVDQTAPL